MQSTAAGRGRVMVNAPASSLLDINVSGTTAVCRAWRGQRMGWRSGKRTDSNDEKNRVKSQGFYRDASVRIELKTSLAPRCALIIVVARRIKSEVLSLKVFCTIFLLRNATSGVHLKSKGCLFFSASFTAHARTSQSVSGSSLPARRGDERDEERAGWGAGVTKRNY